MKSKSARSDSEACRRVSGFRRNASEIRWASPVISEESIPKNSGFLKSFSKTCSGPPRPSTVANLREDSDKDLASSTNSQLDRSSTGSSFRAKGFRSMARRAMERSALSLSEAYRKASADCSTAAPTTSTSSRSDELARRRSEPFFRTAARTTSLSPANAAPAASNDASFDLSSEASCLPFGLFCSRCCCCCCCCCCCF